MAGNRFVAGAEEAVGSATAETIVMVTAPANIRVLVRRIAVFFDPTEIGNVYVRVYRATDTGTSSALTLVKIGNPGETLQSAGAQDFSVEPTVGDVLRRLDLPSGYSEILPYDAPIEVPGSGRVAVEVTANAAGNVSVELECEE